MKKKLTLPKWTAALVLLTALAQVSANPTGPTIVSGDVSFSTPETDTLQVSSSSSRSIVEWESFSIGSSETTDFVLPSSSAVILNRVTEIDPGNMSAILGTISSNGQVYLINPNGILINTNAVVNTGAFLASTLDTDDQDFLNGLDMTFIGGDDTDVYVTHRGTTTASNGDVILLSYQVETIGEIHADGGTYAAGAGMEIVVQPNANDHRIVIVPQTSRNNSPTLPSLGLSESSAVSAIKAELAADGNLYALAIQHEGVIDATGLLGQDSAVIFTAVDGTSYANGTVTAINYSNEGGTIAILGTEVELDNNCTLTATGNYNGGIIYVGGGWGGNDPDYMNATTTYVHENVVINDSALTNGSGGTVVIWADDTTTFNGTILATGGATSGNGGDVEISGVINLYNNGIVDVTAPNGDEGNVTLDPQHLYIGPDAKLPSNVIILP